MSLRDPAYAGSWQSSWDRHVAYIGAMTIKKSLSLGKRSLNEYASVALRMFIAG